MDIPLLKDNSFSVLHNCSRFFIRASSAQKKPQSKQHIGKSITNPINEN
jgi:hypothetical protein